MKKGQLLYDRDFLRMKAMPKTPTKPARSTDLPHVNSQLKELRKERRDFYDLLIWGLDGAKTVPPSEPVRAGPIGGSRVVVPIPDAPKTKREGAVKIEVLPKARKFPVNWKYLDLLPYTEGNIRQRFQAI
jgi:hypothetical protein